MDLVDRLRLQARECSEASIEADDALGEVLSDATSLLTEAANVLERQHELTQDALTASHQLSGTLRRARERFRVDL